MIREACNRFGFGLVGACALLLACNSIVGVEDVTLQKSSDAGSRRSSNNYYDPTADEGSNPVTSTLGDGGTQQTTTNNTPDAGADTGSTVVKGPACFTGPSECLNLAAKCGCNEDCCGHASAICAQVGGLVENTCCLPANTPCATSNDCCGQLLCKSSGAGTTCQ